MNSKQLVERMHHELEEHNISYERYIFTYFIEGNDLVMKKKYDQKEYVQEVIKLYPNLITKFHKEIKENNKNFSKDTIDFVEKLISIK
jgi:hypothetical protein